MNTEKIIKNLESGKTIEFESADEFIDAVKFCKKKYGEKSVWECDDLTHKSFWIVWRKKAQKIGKLQINISLIIKYCEEHKINYG